MISEINLALLKIVSLERSPDIRSILLHVFSKDKKFVKAIRTICANTIKGKLVGRNQRESKFISRNNKVIKFFSKKRNARRKIICQNGGGFLSVLVPLAISLLSPFINGVVQQNDASAI